MLIGLPLEMCAWRCGIRAVIALVAVRMHLHQSTSRAKCAVVAKYKLALDFPGNLPTQIAPAWRALFWVYLPCVLRHRTQVILVSEKILEKCAICSHVDCVSKSKCAISSTIDSATTTDDVTAPPSTIIPSTATSSLLPHLHCAVGCVLLEDQSLT
jgi:hypothetical protein